MSSHEHHECEHQMAYCAKCDVAYCKNCGKEWGGHRTYQYQYPYWQWPNTISIYPSISSGATSTFTVTNHSDH